MISLPAYGPIPPGLWADATFGNGSLTGKSGCNSFGGRYSIGSDGSFRFGRAESTAIGCRRVVERFEGDYLAALGRARSYSVDGRVLTLSDDSGRTVLRWLADAPPRIFGLTWSAFGYRDGPVGDPRAITTPPTSKPITAKFREDGMLTGSDGCGRYSAHFEVNGTHMLITDSSVGTSSCAPSQMHQRESFFAALDSTRRWIFSGPAFQLLNSSGTVAATFAPQ